MNSLKEKMREQQHITNDERIKANYNNYDVNMICDIDYIGDGSEYHLLDIFEPKGIEDILPVIVTVHGGGYASGFKEIGQQQAQYFASKFFRVININYTLMPEANFEKELQELFSVFKWIGENKDKYGFDLNYVFLTGDSSGGHYVMLAAAAQSCKYTQDYFHITPVEYGIKAIAATCPATQFENVIKGDGPIWSEIKTILGEQLDDEEYVEHCSCYNFIDSDYPEIMIVTTPTDSILYQTAKATHEYMLKKGIKHQYKEYTGQENKIDHVFNVLFPDYIESRKANDDIIAFFRSK